MMKSFLSWAIRQWRLRRDPVGYARSIGVRIGEGTVLYYGESATFGSEPYLVRLGRNCHVTLGVRFITHDGGVLVFRRKYPDADILAPIEVGDNVFFGMNAIILPGVRIGDNCVIGAGAVVSQDIPENSVALGVPARVVKSIDEYEQSIHRKSLHCGQMAHAEKTRFLKEHFHIDT